MHMIDLDRRRQAQRQIIINNYQKHYQRLNTIMKSPVKPHIKLNSPRNLKTPLHRMQTQSKYIIKLPKSKYKARNIFSKDSESKERNINHLYSFQKQFDEKMLKNTFYLIKAPNLKKEHIFILIKFRSLSKLAKNSDFMFELRPYKLKSPIISYKELGKDVIGFKFPNIRKFNLYFYEIRAFGREQKDFSNFQINIKAKLYKKNNQTLFLEKQNLKDNQISQLNNFVN